MGQLLNSIKDVSNNYKKYDNWEQAQADKAAQKKYLYENSNIQQDKIELVQDKAKAVIRATEIMDTKSENNCENVEQVVGMLAALPAFGFVLAQQPLTSVYEKHLNKKV